MSARIARQVLADASQRGADPGTVADVLTFLDDRPPAVLPRPRRGDR